MARRTAVGAMDLAMGAEANRSIAEHREIVAGAPVLAQNSQRCGISAGPTATNGIEANRRIWLALPASSFKVIARDGHD